MEKLLEIKNLNVGFLMGNGQIQVLNQVSLDICENEVLAVVGETGCGKSVTGRAILQPGDFEIDGRRISKTSREGNRFSASELCLFAGSDDANRGAGGRMCHRRRESEEK